MLFTFLFVFCVCGAERCSARILLLDDGCNCAIFDCKLHSLYRFYWSFHFTSRAFMANGIVFNLSTFVECLKSCSTNFYFTFYTRRIHIVCDFMLLYTTHTYRFFEKSIQRIPLNSSG